MTHQQVQFQKPAQTSSKAMFENQTPEARTEGAHPTNTQKLMGWVDELPAAASTDFPARRDELAYLMREAAELTRKAESLRSRAYLAACRLEGQAREHWMQKVAAFRVNGLSPAASTESPARLEDMAGFLDDAKDLTRRAEALRSRAYFGACRLEGCARACWTADQIEQAKRRAAY